jgi:hypothetical protein
VDPPPPIFAKARHLDPDKLEIAKAEFNVWNLLAFSPFHFPLGFTLAYGTKKRQVMVTMQQLPPS